MTTDIGEPLPIPCRPGHERCAVDGVECECERIEREKQAGNSDTTKCRWFWQRWVCREPATANGLDWTCATCGQTPAPNIGNRQEDQRG